MRSDGGDRMLVHFLADVYRRAGRQSCFTVVVHLLADFYFATCRSDARLGVFIDCLTDSNVAAGHDLCNRVLVDTFADVYRRGGFQVCI